VILNFKSHKIFQKQKPFWEEKKRFFGKNYYFGRKNLRLSRAAGASGHAVGITSCLEVGVGGS